MIPDEELLYKVVVSVEAQYSLWPDARDIPVGWVYAGVRGTKAECLAYIEAVWVDIYPLSLQTVRREEKKP